MLNHPLELDGFIHRLWGKFGVDEVAMMEIGVLVVRFKTNDDKMEIMEASTILYEAMVTLFEPWRGGCEGGSYMGSIPKLALKY